MSGFHILPVLEEEDILLGFDQNGNEDTHGAFGESNKNTASKNTNNTCLVRKKISGPRINYGRRILSQKGNVSSNEGACATHSHSTNQDTSSSGRHLDDCRHEDTVSKLVFVRSMDYMKSTPRSPYHTNMDGREAKLHSIPKICINAADKDEGGSVSPRYLENSFTGNIACSLPNLAGDEKTPRNGLTNVGELEHGIKDLDRIPINETSGQHLSVYCSPRISRRTFPGGSTGDLQTPDDSEFSWLTAFDPSRSLRRSRSRLASDRSVESEGSLRSMSHLSIFGSLERFVSCDRLSLPDSLDETHERLRRVYSLPDHKVKIVQGSNLNAPFTITRDTKSCSNLKHEGGSINHAVLEANLSHEGNLLCPPIVTGHGGEPKQIRSFEQLYNDACEADDRMERLMREKRVHQWLKNVDADQH